MQAAPEAIYRDIKQRGIIIVEPESATSESLSKSSS